MRYFIMMSHIVYIKRTGPAYVAMRTTNVIIMNLDIRLD